MDVGDVVVSEHGIRAVRDLSCRDDLTGTIAKFVLEPIFEADFEDNTYGYLYQENIQADQGI